MKIAFTGDMFLGRAKADLLDALNASEAGEAAWIINFEGVLYDDPARLIPTRRKILLDSNTESLAALDKLNVVCATIGNNHIGDYGNDIAEFTASELRKRFDVFGAGLERSHFHLKNCSVGEVNLGLASYCTADTNPLMCSGARIGPRPLSIEGAERDLTILRESAKHCVAIVHWGLEDYNHPRPALVKFGRKLIDLGFNAVIGHHSHTPQGYEKYKDGWIFYSLGNFYFDDHFVEFDGVRHGVQWMPSRSWGLVPFFRVLSDGLQLERVAIVQTLKGSKPVFVESKSLRAKLERLSGPLSNTRYSRLYRKLTRREDWRIRWEEFSVKSNKGLVILKKLLSMAGVGRKD